MVLLATCYMTQAASFQRMNERDLLQYLLAKRSCSKIGGPCTRSKDCCDNPGSGYEGPAPRCDYEEGVCVIREK